MFCTKCGEVLPDDALFCTSCGEPVETETEEGGGSEAGAADPGRKKGPSKTVLIAMGAVAGVAACGLVAAAFVWNRPGAVVLRGIKNTVEAACTQESGVSEYLGMNKINKMLTSGDSRQTMTFEGAAGSSDYGITSASVGFNWQLDKSKDGKTSGKVTGTVANMDAIGLEFYNDKDITVVGLPDLYKKYFYLNHKELEEKLESSKFRAKLREDFDINISGNYSKEERDIAYGYWTASKGDWAALAKNMKITGLDKKKFTIGGKSKACKGYELTIQKDDLKNINEGFFNYLSGNSYVVDGLGAMSYGWYDYDKRVSAVKDDFKTMRKELAKALKDDLVIRLYIGPKGRIVYAESEYSLRIDSSERLNLSCALEMTGEKNPLDNLKLEGELDDGRYGNSAGFTVERELKDGKTSLKDSLEVEGYIKDNYGDRLSCRTTAEGSLNKENAEWEVELGLVVPGFRASAAAEGSVEDLKKGSRFNILLDDVTLKAYDSTAPILEVEASYGVEPLKEAVVNPGEDAKTVNVLNLSADDWKEIEDEIEDNLYNRSGSSMGGFGFGGYGTAATTAAPAQNWD
ncbi:MAG: zinc ribbon domain-containing protein [Clostridium sp.]|nr:zinc ribbon domain-containing protein [Clostridium sp.]